jgi:hypothetical protein
VNEVKAVQTSSDNFCEWSDMMEDVKTKPDESLILGDVIEFLWTEWTDGDMYLLGQVEDERDGGKQLTVAVYDDPTDVFAGDIPLFMVRWNQTKDRYEGRKV